MRRGSIEAAWPHRFPPRGENRGKVSAGVARGEDSLGEFRRRERVGNPPPDTSLNPVRPGLAVRASQSEIGPSFQPRRLRAHVAIPVVDGGMKHQHFWQFRRPRRTAIALPYLRFGVTVIALFLIARLLRGHTLSAAATAAALSDMPYQRGQSRTEIVLSPQPGCSHRSQPAGHAIRIGRMPPRRASSARSESCRTTMEGHLWTKAADSVQAVRSAPPAASCCSRGLSGHWSPRNCSRAHTFQRQWVSIS